MPSVPSSSTPAHASNRPSNPADRQGGATQRTPQPGSNGRMNERDNQRLLRIALAVVVLAFLGVLTFNAFWLPGTGSTTEAPVPTETAPNTVPGTSAPASIGSNPAPR